MNKKNFKRNEKKYSSCAHTQEDVKGKNKKRKGKWEEKFLPSQRKVSVELMQKPKNQKEGLWRYYYTGCRPSCSLRSY